MSSGLILALTPAYAPRVRHGSQRWQHRRPMRVVPQHLPWYAVLGVEAGRHRLELGGQRWYLQPGQVAILVPGRNWLHHITTNTRLLYAVGSLIPHESFSQDGRRPGRSAKAAEPIQPDPIAVWGVELPVVQPTAISAGLMQDLRQVCDSWWRSPQQRLVAHHAWASLLLRAAIAALEAQQSTDLACDDPVVGQALRMLQQGALPESAQAWAQRVGMHRNGFDQRFLAATGEHPGAYLRRKRLLRVQHFLKYSDDCLDIIASECGFPSVAALSSAFRRQCGLSPVHWRRQVRSAP